MGGTTPAIDYDALAQQHGAAIDYDSLASQHGGSAGDAGPSTYSKLTAGYNQGAEDFAQKHPIFGPMVRFLDAAGGAAMSTPEGIYQALSHPSDTAKGALESLAAWRDPNVRKAALSVLPEALGQGVGNVAGGEAAGAVGGAAASAVPSAADVGRLLRDPATGKLKTITREAARVAGVAAGHALYPGEGGIVGAFVGPKIADAIIPKVEPTIAKAVPVTKNPTPGGYTGPAAARAAAKAAADAEKSPIVTTQSPEIPSEGRPATWRNAKVEDLSSRGGPLAFDAAKQAQLRQLDVPNVGLVADPRATAVPTLSSPRSVTTFDAEGNPVPAGGVGPMADVMTKKPKAGYAYRVRDVGESGVPIEGNSRAHATTTLEDAQRLQPGREDVQGKPQEIVKMDLSKLTKGKDYQLIPRGEGEVPWVKMLRPMRENEVERLEE